ncbi:MAG: iron-containing redox enzyme family protein [Burkholderiales bacterium]|nr:iron-containing redox enzyme family protein [Burkholderiales bacterium]MBP9768574.1 iron-containing redox enzyme family protein [Burkholderiales bacterium]
MYITCEEAKSFALGEMEKLFLKVPFTREFHAGIAINEDYYARHLLETVLRIRLNNEVDAYCLHKIDHTNNLLAVKLAQYLAEELGHENFFKNDLKYFSINENQIDDTRVFFATEKLIGYMYYCINNDGPLITMVWNWFVELYSDIFNAKITRKAAIEFGKTHTVGFEHHIGIDDELDHVGLMYSTVELAVKSQKDADLVKYYLTNLIDLLGDYFQELYDETIGKEKLLA